MAWHDSYFHLCKGAHPGPWGAVGQPGWGGGGCRGIRTSLGRVTRVDYNNNSLSHSLVDLWDAEGGNSNIVKKKDFEWHHSWIAVMQISLSGVR